MPPLFKKGEKLKDIIKRATAQKNKAIEDSFLKPPVSAAKSKYKSGSRKRR